MKVRVGVRVEAKWLIKKMSVRLSGKSKAMDEINFKISVRLRFRYTFKLDSII